MSLDYEALIDYAKTQRQIDILNACIDSGSQEKAA